MTIRNIPLKERGAILDYQSILFSRFPNHIRRMILFGSYAKGKFNKNSDIDLLIVVDRKKRELWKEIVELSFDSLLKHEVDISPLVIDEEKYTKWSPLLERIKKDGIEIWHNKSNSPFPRRGCKFP